MDKLSRLQALTGDQNIAEQESQSEPLLFPTAKPIHVYEGIVSEGDEAIANEGIGPKVEDYIRPIGPIGSVPYDTPYDFAEYQQLHLGELSEEGESFCPLQVIRRYPYAYIGTANKQKVAEKFFDQGKLLNNTWDFFYIYHSFSESKQPIILVATKQFEQFLAIINRKLNINLTLPTGGANNCFRVTFPNDGTPQPRYLGRSTTSEMASQLKLGVPPNSYRLKGEPDVLKPTDRSLNAFREKVNIILQAQKGKKLANKEKQKAERIAKQQSWSHSIKRVQRYLGLREAQHGYHAEHDAATKAPAAQLPPTIFVAHKVTPFVQEGDVVFVSIDVEAYERDSSKVTEIGVSTLDTRDITALAPGEGGAGWMKVIRSRHFRINEYKHLNNTEFVDGCADRFEFGVSEFINLRDAPRIVASCFKPPFSKSGEVAPVIEELPKRNIILVGHDVVADVNFLRSIGYDVYNMSNLVEQVDTAAMWRYLTRDSNPRNLGSILAELGIIGWNLHNAGNDATYTLQAMVSISIKHIVDKQKTKASKEADRTKRISESVAEATINANEREQGWSSGGDSDGGEPVTPAARPPPKIGKKLVSSLPWDRNNNSTSKSASMYAEGPWTSSKGPASSRYVADGPYARWGRGKGGALMSPNPQGPDAAPPIASQWSRLENSMNDMRISEIAPPANNAGGWRENQGSSNVTSDWDISYRQ